MKKQISIKPFLKIMKELKADRALGQKRVIEFNDELAEKINRHNILVRELGEVQHRITQLRHLVEMYKVMDDHKIMDLWELETACGLTKKKYPDWKFDFEKTKDGITQQNLNIIEAQQTVSGSLLVGKHILDCCCGSRMFWFNKSNPAVLFADIRELETDLCDGRKLEVKPDVIADFRKMPFPDNTFKMVVFDPPHLNKLGQDTWMAQKYGVLLPSWEHDIKEGFEEAMRVLQPFGTLIFKWNEVQITTSKVLQIIGVEPLFGHPSGKHGRTKWMAFMKGVSGNNNSIMK